MAARPQRRRSTAPKGFDLWAPRVTQIIGWLGIVFLSVFWAMTDRIEPMLLGLFGSFATGGMLASAWRDFRSGLRRVLEEPEEDPGESS